MTREPVPESRIGPDDWDAAVAATDGPQIVVGGPGTGKTEFLVRRAVHLLDAGLSPGALLILGFSRRGVADIRARIRRTLSRSFGEIDAGTFHSFTSRLMEAHADRVGWPTIPQILTGPEQVAVVQDLLRSEDPARWSPAFRSILASATFAAEITDFLLRCREQLIDAGTLEELATSRADWKGLPAFLRKYDAALRASGRIDYGTLLAEGVSLLCHDAIARETDEQYRYVLVDEYQDTTRAQSRLLAALVRNHGNLTVAADPYQSIYSFRGADVANVARFPTDFADETGVAARRVILTTSFRVPAEILGAAERVTSGEIPGAAGPVVPAPGRGRVETYCFGQQTEEAEWIASELERMHLEHGLPYGRAAVFVRSTRRFLPELSRALERRHIPHDDPDSRLADHPAVRFVLDCVVAATGDEGPAETDRAIRRILLGPLFATPLGLLRDIQRYRLRRGCGWVDAIRDLVADGEGLAGILDDHSWATRLPAMEGFWRVWTGLPQMRAVVIDPERSEERAAWSSFAQVLGRWNERSPEATLADYRRLVDDEEFEAQPLLSYRRPGGDRLTLTTLHQSKGLEFDVVFIADAVEGVFPDLRNRDSLLGVRHLLPHLPPDNPSYVAFRLQEERRLAYTAMTRSSRRVVWTATSTGFDEGTGIPSRFLSLVTGAADFSAAGSRPALRTNPVTAREAEALLRRTAADPALPATERLAAVSVLAEGEHIGLRSPMSFPGVLPAGPDTGLVGESPTFSPSQAESYRRCPLRYAYERRLKVGDEPGVYAEFGLLIHAVLEDVERSAIARGDRSGTIDEALGSLDSRFDVERFGGGPFSDAWKRRGQDLLRRLYANWPSDAAAVAVEWPLSLDLDGTRWIGKADRIEADPTGLRIVDYKTSKRPHTKEEAAASPQLGFYLLAVAADDELSGFGLPHQAEMWFPAADRQRGVTTRTFDISNLPDVRDELVALAHGILAENWTPTPNALCDRCPVRHVCPEWPEGREAYQS